MATSIQLKFRFLIIFLSANLLMSMPAWSAQTIKSIEVNGAQRIDKLTIMSYMNLKVGGNVDNTGTDSALKSLFASGLFADVNIENQNGAIKINVVENPVINEIVFEGNDKIKDDELYSEIQLRTRQVFTRTKVQSDVSRINQIYRRQGRFSVSVQPKMIELSQNRVNLIFEIQEGEVTKVRSIRFVGNKAFSDGKLRSLISTKETAWYRLLSSSDQYDPDRLSYDKELIREYYFEQGYADFQILSAVAELSNRKDNFFITLTVEEGGRYKIGQTNIESALRDFDSSVLNNNITLLPGDWYDAAEVKKIIENMTNQLGDLQYAFVDIRPNINKNKAEKTIDISFNISETPRVFVERINVNGNIRTLDKVLRREMELVEGDPFNRSKLAKSERNIKNLNFFEKTNISVSQGSAPDKTVVDIDVHEKSTGELSVGAGFSTSDGPLADFSIRERNLLGKGQDLSLGAVIAGERTQFNLGFTEPYFLNRDLSAGVDLYHTTRDYQDESSYDQQRSGGGLRIGYPLSENWRQTLSYKIQRNEITDVDSDASRYISDQEGTRTTSALSQRLVYDTRDSNFMTTSGLMYWLDAEVAGLGGDAKYVSAKTGASYFHPLSDQWILNILGEAGAIEAYGDADVEINERYFLGGSTLRGFERSGVGPRDTSTNDSLGGNYFYRASAEMSFPLGLPKEMGIRGHTFNDVGSLYEINETGSNLVDQDSIRAAAGIGISWRSPLGPIRLDYAVPYLKEDYDEEEKFRFDFGTRF